MSLPRLSPTLEKTGTSVRGRNARPHEGPGLNVRCLSYTNQPREGEGESWLKTTGNNLRHAEDSGSKSSLPLQREDHTTSK